MSQTPAAAPARPAVAKRHRIIRAAATLAVAAFGIVAVVAMASESPNKRTTAVDVISPAPLESPSPSAAPTGQAAGSTDGAGSTDNAPLGADGGGSSGSSGLGGVDSSTTPDTGGTGQSTGDAGGSESPEPDGGSTAETPTTAKAAVINPLLTTSSFAAAVGTPVVCGLVSSATGPLVSDPQMAQLVATITSACGDAGQNGSAAIESLNQRLIALAVLNPALDPLIDQFATLFNSAANNQGLPFVDSIAYLADLLEFFHS